MSEEDFTLTYSNEDDRAYGLAGMAISVAALDALDKLVGISLDAPDTMVTFSNEYYFTGSPSVSPKAVWDLMLRNFHLTSAMAVGNVMARAIVRRHKDVPSAILDEIHSRVAEEGKDFCGLEDDEIDELFSRVVSYTRCIFGNPRLHPAIDEFVHVISRKRTLSGRELSYELEMLRLL